MVFKSHQIFIPKDDILAENRDLEIVVNDLPLLQVKLSRGTSLEESLMA